MATFKKDFCPVCGRKIAVTLTERIYVHKRIKSISLEELRNWPGVPGLQTIEYHPGECPGSGTEV